MTWICDFQNESLFLINHLTVFWKEKKNLKLMTRFVFNLYLFVHVRILLKCWIMDWWISVNVLIIVLIQCCLVFMNILIAVGLKDYYGLYELKWINPLSFCETREKAWGVAYLENDKNSCSKWCIVVISLVSIINALTVSNLRFKTRWKSDEMR